jgi:hypothetical protein
VVVRAAARAPITIQKGAAKAVLAARVVVRVAPARTILVRTMTIQKGAAKAVAARVVVRVAPARTILVRTMTIQKGAAKAVLAARVAARVAPARTIIQRARVAAMVEVIRLKAFDDDVIRMSLSYAMFDTLYGCRSFQPKSFIQFLLNMGEHGLAEEIALAAIEKSNGSQEQVKFVLDELVPQSNDPNQLIELASDILGQQSGPASVGGKDYLAQWHLRKGNSDQAFAAALLMKSSVNTHKSEVDVLTHALPLTTTALRRQELKAACPWLLSQNVIGMFTDEEWPDFMSSLIPFTPTNDYYGYQPQPESYLMFAASSKMQAPRSIVIATYYIDQVIDKGIRHIKDIRSRSAPTSGGSYRNSNGTHSLVQEFVSIKTKIHDLTKKTISDFPPAISQQP